jgi:hypothetical protein
MSANWHCSCVLLLFFMALVCELVVLVSHPEDRCDYGNQNQHHRCQKRTRAFHTNLLAGAI